MSHYTSHDTFNGGIKHRQRDRENFFNPKVLKPTSCQYIIALRLDTTLVMMYSCVFISFLYSEDGQVLSKKALKKQAKQAKKDERKANVASKLVREIKREREDIELIETFFVLFRKQKQQHGMQRYETRLV